MGLLRQRTVLSVCNAKGLAGAVRNLQRVCRATLISYSMRQRTRYVVSEKSQKAYKTKLAKTKPAPYRHSLHVGTNFLFFFTPFFLISQSSVPCLPGMPQRCAVYTVCSCHQGWGGPTGGFFYTACSFLFHNAAGLFFIWGLACQRCKLQGNFGSVQSIRVCTS